MDTVTLTGSNTELTFSVSDKLALMSFSSEGKTYSNDPAFFFRAAIRDGEFAGEYPIDQWTLTKFAHKENTMQAFGVVILRG